MYGLYINQALVTLLFQNMNAGLTFKEKSVTNSSKTYNGLTFFAYLLY